MSIAFQNWTRNYTYTSDYFLTTYDLYIKQYAAFPVNYYSINLNKDVSVYDSDKLISGSYEKLDIGELSGVKWDKITMFPVFGVDTVSLSGEANEQGLNFRNSIQSSINIPDVYGLKPSPGDIVDLNFGVLKDKLYTRALFTVSGFDLAHYGDYMNIYKCYLKIAPGFQKSDIEKQINKYYQFYEPTKQILPAPNANVLTKIMSRGITLHNNLKTLFDHDRNYYYTITD